MITVALQAQGAQVHLCSIQRKVELLGRLNGDVPFSTAIIRTLSMPKAGVTAT